MVFSRRDLGKLVLGAAPLTAMAARKIDSVIHGVQFGLQSYIFTGIGLPQDSLVDQVIQSMTESGLGECDLYAPLIEPARFWDRIRSGPAGRGAAVPPEVAADRARARQELAEWRNSVSLDYYRAIRGKFENAGIAIYGLSGFPGSTEQELSRTFEIAGVLGAQLINLNFGLSAAKLVAPLADKSRFTVGIVGNPNMNATDPDAVARPERYDEAVALSKKYAIVFDIGDATGGGYDALKFVQERLDRITLLYLKDRRKDRTSVPFGEGDSPVKEVLRLVKERKNSIRCYFDCDHKTTNRAADVKRSFEYAKAALA
jgi:sugar phosphate isomerase/epimerase